jgi:hypothetical protein
MKGFQTCTKDLEDFIWQDCENFNCVKIVDQLSILHSVHTYIKCTYNVMAYKKAIKNLRMYLHQVQGCVF